jgi:hypothetical protein
MAIIVIFIYVPSVGKLKMNKEFLHAWVEDRPDWLCWLGQPMLYDGGLCVNRSLEEQEYSNLNRYRGDLEA